MRHLQLLLVAVLPFAHLPFNERLEIRSQHLHYQTRLDSVLDGEREIPGEPHVVQGAGNVLHVAHKQVENGPQELLEEALP